MLRCFRTASKGEKRYGLWIYTKERRGVFYHGDRNEVQAPKWNVGDVVKRFPDGAEGVEICPRRLLMLLRDWPKAVADAKATFERHKNDKEGE